VCCSKKNASQSRLVVVADTPVQIQSSLVQALHRTSAGEVTGRLRIKPAKAKQKYDDLLPPVSRTTCVLFLLEDRFGSLLALPLARFSDISSLTRPPLVVNYCQPTQGSELRRLAFQYYKTDFEMFANIDIPPFDNSGYVRRLLLVSDLAVKGLIWAEHPTICTYLLDCLDLAASCFLSHRRYKQDLLTEGG